MPRPMYPAPISATRIGLPWRARSSSALSTITTGRLLDRPLRPVEWPAPIRLGNHRDRERPRDPEGRVVVADSAGPFRRIELRCLITDLGVLREGLVPVGDTLRDVQQLVALRGEIDTEPPPVRDGIAAE